MKTEQQKPAEAEREHWFYDMWDGVRMDEAEAEQSSAEWDQLPEYQ